MEVRCWKQYLMDADVDMCGVTETHGNEKKDRMMHSVMGDDYHCITKIRKNRKARDHGSGGLAIVVRKGRGIPKIAKAKGSDEILWVEMKEIGRKIFVAVVYIVPSKSTRYHQNGAIRRELTADIMRFTAEGIVIVMGDLNSRIAGSLPMEGGGRHRMRENKDKIVNNNGKEWTLLTRTTKMVTLTGLYGEADYTCFNEQGNSVPDHICIDSGNEHRVRAMMNDREIMWRINTDHSMISAEIDMGTWRRETDSKSQDERGPTLTQRRTKIQLNRVKKREVWQSYQEKCDEHTGIARIAESLDRRTTEADNENSRQETEEAWTEVRNLMITLERCAEKIAEREGDIQMQHINQSLASSYEIAEKIEEKARAWRNLKNSKDEGEEKILKRVYKNKKNRLNKARRRLRDKARKDKIEEIDSLKNTYPGEFWRLMKSLAGRKKRKVVGTTGIDENGEEVHGKKVGLIWMKTFEKLGSRRGADEEFDREADSRVEEEVERIMKDNTERGQGDLNEPIRYEETRKAITKLKNGKTAGIDEIVSETIQYGGEPVHIVIW